MNPLLMSMAGPMMAAQPEAQGLLQAPQQAQGQGMMGLLGDPRIMMGLQLLSAGRDSRIDPFQAAASGLSQAQAYKDSRTVMDQKKEELAHRKKMLELQVQKLNEPTTSMKDFEFRRGLSGDAATLWDQMHSRAQNTPASLQEMAWLQDPNRTEEEIANYWMNKRAGQIYEVGGGGRNILNPGTDAPAPLVTPEVATANDAARSQAIAQATELGKGQGVAQTAIPGAYANAERALAAVGRLKNHPALESMTGAWSLNPAQYAPGTEARDFVEQMLQVSGEAFLQAREGLKGGGQITDYEGQRAEVALVRMQNAQTKQQFLDGLAEFEDAIVKGYAAKERAAAGDFSAPGELKVTPLQDGWGIKQDG